VQDLTAAGLGLDYGTVALVAARDEWRDLGAALAEQMAEVLGDRAVAVEHVGSTAIPGLLAKPILDLAAGAPDEPDPDVVRASLDGAGWEYRGDAADEGGLVFVLETRPRHRVAHLHVVRHEGRQWRGYLAFRDLLLREPSARASYESVKRSMHAAFPSDPRTYTAGKRRVVESILRGEWRTTRQP